MVMPTKKTCQECGRQYMQSDAKIDFRNICDGCRDPRNLSGNDCHSFGGIMDLMYTCQKKDNEDIESGKAIRCEYCKLLANEFIGVTESGQRKYYCPHCFKITLGSGRIQCQKIVEEEKSKLAQL